MGPLTVVLGLGLSVGCSSSSGTPAGTGGHGSGGSANPGSGGSASPGSGGSGNPGSGGSGNPGSGGSGNPGSGGSGNPGTGGSGNPDTGGSGNPGTGGSGNPGTGGSGNPGTGGNGGGSVGGANGSCTNTNMSAINLDASGYVCNNTWGIKGAWYCYSDGSDTTTSCKGSDGKGAGAVPWNAAATAMCLSGTMSAGTTSKYVGMGFKVNSGPPGSGPAFGTWDASRIVGWAVTLAPGSSMKGSGGGVLNIQFPTPTNMDAKGDAPGVTIPGVGSSPVTYNVLFSDGVLANNPDARKDIDPTKLTDFKLIFAPDSVARAYDFCIKSVVPLMTAPSPVVATGSYGPAWTNQSGQAVNGINGYAVQSAPFPMNGNAMTMQVMATATGVGFTYATGSGFQAPNSAPGAFPAVISGWGPGEKGIQLFGPYKADKKVSQLTSMKSSWSFTMGASGDAAYDLWFSNTAKPTVPPAIELMIWIGNKDKMPLGYGTAAGPAVDGRTPYKADNNGTGQKVVSYWVATGTNGSPVTNFDLLPYIKDAASHGYAGLTNDFYLIGVQTGFEVYSGTWTTTDYNINIQ